MTPTPIDNVTNDLPLPEPPPQLHPSQYISSFVQDHLNDIESNNINNNDSTRTTIKPSIVNLVLDNESQQSELEKCNHYDHIPIISSTTHQTTIDVDTDTTSQDVDITNLMKPTVSQVWTPSLNNVIEETAQDIQHSSSKIIAPSQQHISNKRFRGRLQKYSRELARYHLKIAKAISKGGIYRVQITSAQNDGGANRLVTSKKDLLLHFQDIPDYAISGVKDGELAIYCTGQGYIP